MSLDLLPYNSHEQWDQFTFVLRFVLATVYIPRFTETISIGAVSGFATTITLQPCALMLICASTLMLTISYPVDLLKTRVQQADGAIQPRCAAYEMFFYVCSRLLERPFSKPRRILYRKRVFAGYGAEQTPPSSEMSRG